MAGVFDQTIVNQVQQANDIVDVISEHVSLKKKGREMVGLCPFHDDHRPSMNVNAAKQIFKCFACGAGGGVFTFVQMRENLTFPQALRRLADRAGIKLKEPEAGRSKPQADQANPNDLARINAWEIVNIPHKRNHFLFVLIHHCYAHVHVGGCGLVFFKDVHLYLRNSYESHFLRQHWVFSRIEKFYLNIALGKGRVFVENIPYLLLEINHVRRKFFREIAFNIDNIIEAGGNSLTGGR